MVQTAIFLASFYAVLFTGGGETDVLRQFAWKNRVLLIFSGPGTQNEAFQQCDAIQKLESEARERQLIVGHITEDGGKIGSLGISKAEAMALSNRYGVTPNSFSVVLIGKDTGVKLKRFSQVPPQDIFDIIDRMPMRRSEVLRKQAE